MATNLVLGATTIRSHFTYTNPLVSWPSRDSLGMPPTNLQAGWPWVSSATVIPTDTDPASFNFWRRGITVSFSAPVFVESIAARVRFSYSTYIDLLVAAADPGELSGPYGNIVAAPYGFDLVQPAYEPFAGVSLTYTPDRLTIAARISDTMSRTKQHWTIYFSNADFPSDQSWFAQIDALFMGSWTEAQSWTPDDPPPPDVEPETLDDLKDDDGPPAAVLIDIQPTHRPPNAWTEKPATNDTWTNTLADTAPTPTTGEGSSYSYPLVTSVSVDGTAMTSVAVGATDGANNSWAYDPDTGVVDLNYSTGSDPNPHMVVLGLQLFFCSGGPSGGGLAFNGNDYLSYLAQDGLPKIVMALQDPLLGGASSHIGDIAFINSDGKFDKIAARFRWESQRVNIRFGGGALPYSEYYAMPPAVIFGTRWTEERFTLSCRSAVDELMTSVPATGKIVAADITRDYTFTHELVASIYGNSTSNVARHTRAISTLAPYLRSPTDVDPNALANAPIGAVKPLTYGTCYGVQGIVLAESDTERMVLLSANGIHQLLDVVAKDGYRASQAYHQHGSAPSTWSSDGVYRSEVVVDLVYGVVHEVYDDTLSDAQAAPLETTAWFLNSGNGPFSYDLEGEESSDGTMLSNPADVISALVTRSGVSATMNATKQTEAKVDSDLYAVSLVVTDASKLQDVLTPLLKTISAAVYVDTAGTVSLMLLTPSMAPDHTLVEETGDFWELEVSTETAQVLTSVLLTYPAPVQGGVATVQTTTIAEASRMRATESLESFDAPLDGLGSNYLAALHILHRRMKPTALIHLTSGIQVVNVQPGQVVKLTKTRLPAEALGYIIGQVQSVEIDGNTMVNRLVIDDSKTVMETPYQAFLESDDVSLTWASRTNAQRIVRGFWTDDNGYVVTADSSTFRRSMYY